MNYFHRINATLTWEMRAVRIAQRECVDHQKKWYLFPSHHIVWEEQKILDEDLGIN